MTPRAEYRNASKVVLTTYSKRWNELDAEREPLRKRLKELNRQLYALEHASEKVAQLDPFADPDTEVTP